jgi:hypothetical protein
MEAEQEPVVLELEASTSEPARPARPPVSGDLTVKQAVNGWDVSEATLRRRLAAGELAGAHQVPGPKGLEWRIPEAALQSAGLQYRSDEADTVVAARLQTELQDLKQQNAGLVAELAGARHQLELLRLQVELTSATVDDLRLALRRIPELQPAPRPDPAPRRRWFGRH